MCFALVFHYSVFSPAMLGQVVKEQNSKIMELRQRCASLSTEASAARAGAGPKPSPAAVTVPSKVAVEVGHDIRKRIMRHGRHVTVLLAVVVNIVAVIAVFAARDAAGLL